MLAGGAAIALPLEAAAATEAPMPVVGFLSGRTPAASVDLLASFHRGLAETGFASGRNVTIEYRWADGQYDRLAALASELVKRQVAVIAATGGSVSGLAAKAATTTIPIVFASGGDAVKLGLVPSLSRPGGNVTGVNITFAALGPKRLELLREMIPKATTVAMLVNLNYPSAADEMAQVKAGAAHLGLEIAVFNAPTDREVEGAFSAVTERHIGGVLIGDDPFLAGRRDQLVRLAANHAVPTMYFSRDFADAGGLLSYGPDINDAYRLVGVYVGRILKGEKPSDLPVQQPSKFDLVVNLKTAKSLGVTVPQSLLALADDVIE
jgi:putative ABC transport system substrate-binding protein